MNTPFFKKAIGLFLLLLGFLGSLQASPDLSDVAAKVKVMPGIEIEAETVSPSIVPITFRIATNGYFYAKFPTTEQYTDLTNFTTWMPDRREYSIETNRFSNPLPVGFDALWPGTSVTYRQVEPAAESQFHDWPCYEIPCKGDSEYIIHLFVERATLLPRGTRVNLKGTVHELVYRTIRVAAQDRAQVTFTTPADARPAGKFVDPRSSLVKAGATLLHVTGCDATGKDLSLKQLMDESSKGAVLNFWFSACMGCVEEMPYFVKINPLLKDHGITFIGVNAIDDNKTVRRTSEKNALPYPTIVGEDAEALVKELGIKAYPVTVVLDKNLRVVDAINGFDLIRIKKALRSLGVEHLPAASQ